MKFIEHIKINWIVLFVTFSFFATGILAGYAPSSASAALGWFNAAAYFYLYNRR